jgi:hypothetical protein
MQICARVRENSGDVSSVVGVRIPPDHQRFFFEQLDDRSHWGKLQLNQQNNFKTQDSASALEVDTFGGYDKADHEEHEQRGQTEDAERVYGKHERRRKGGDDETSDATHDERHEAKSDGRNDE